MKYLITILALLSLAASALAQTRVLATSTNGTVISGRTNAVTFTNPVAWNNSTNAATTITNLFSSNSLPSGAAAAGSVLTAAGDGSSSFVANRTVTQYTTSDQSKTNWAFNNVNQTNNNDAQLNTWSLDANSSYRIDYFIEYSVTTNALTLIAGFGFSTNLASRIMRSGYGVNIGGSLAPIVVNGGSSSFLIPTTGGTSGGSWLGGSVTIATASQATMNFRWAPSADTNAAITLHSNSVISVTKIAP